MSTFVYKAKKDTAETVTGQIKASSQEEAIELINQLGLLPVSVEEKRGEDSSVNLKERRSVKANEIYLFSRQLANLLKSGLTILKALSILNEQTQDPYFKKVLTFIAQEVKNGRSFSDSLAVFPHLFPILYVTMVKAGEESGNLPEMLSNVAIYQKNQAEITHKVIMALVYPALMLTVGTMTIYIILTFALPKMIGLFQNIGSDLPLPTVILLAVSKILSQGWWIIAGLLIAAVMFFRRYSQTPHGKKEIALFSLKAPLFGPILLKTELARFARTLDLLLKSGVPIVRALEVTIPIIKNEIIRGGFQKCRDDLLTGGAFGEGILEIPYIPKMIGHLITIGEESGNLNDVLSEIATTYEQETNEQIKVMTTLLEPIMILLVGGVVAFIVFAMLLPIFQIDILTQ